MKRVLWLLLPVVLLFSACGTTAPVEKEQRIQIYSPDGSLVQMIDKKEKVDELLSILLEAEKLEQAPPEEEPLGTLVVEQQETLKLGQDPDSRQWGEILRFQMGEGGGMLEVLPGEEGESMLTWPVALSPQEEERLAALWEAEIPG